MKTGLQILGTLTLSAKRADGTTVSNTYKNLIVNWGLVSLAGVIAGTATTLNLDYIALGDGSTTPALGDTTLGNELRRDLATVSHLASPNNNQVQFQKVHATGAVTGTFKEAGIFDAASAGNMLNRIVFSDFIVGISDTLTVTWLIEVKNAA